MLTTPQVSLAKSNYGSINTKDPYILTLEGAQVNDDMITNLVSTHPLVTKISIKKASNLTDRGLKALEGFQNLKKLSINKVPQITIKALKVLLSKLTKLEKLEFTDTLEKLSENQAEIITILEGGKNMKTIRWGGSTNRTEKLTQ